MRNILARLSSFALGAGLMTLFPRVADAADPIAAPPSVQTDSPERRLAIMNSEIELFASRARAQRRTTVLAGLVGAAALVPAGYVLSQRSDPVSQSIGTGMEVGGAAPLAFSALSLSRSGMERLRDRFEESLGSTTARAELAETMEAEWRHTAEAAHDRRVLFGVVGLVLGAASAGAGLFFLLSDPTAGLSRDQQYTLGSSLVGPGVPFMGVGIRALLQESIEETSWDAYRALKSGTESAKEHSAGVAINMTALRGGAFATLNYSF
jgi:hypothetical protein